MRILIITFTLYALLHAGYVNAQLRFKVGGEFNFTTSKNWLEPGDTTIINRSQGPSLHIEYKMRIDESLELGLSLQNMSYNATLDNQLVDGHASMKNNKTSDGKVIDIKSVKLNMKTIVFSFGYRHYFSPKVSLLSSININTVSSFEEDFKLEQGLADINNINSSNYNRVFTNYDLKLTWRLIRKLELSFGLRYIPFNNFFIDSESPSEIINFHNRTKRQFGLSTSVCLHLFQIKRK